MIQCTHQCSNKNESYNLVMGSLWDKLWVQFLFAMWVKFAFIVQAVALLPLMLITERFIEPEQREKFWMLASHHNAVRLLKLSGIKLDLRTKVPNYEHPVIYVSNHPSWMDGFLLLAIVGPELNSLVAPFKSFPFPVGLWMRKAGAIDVQRDKYDEDKHPEAHEKEAAIESLIQALNEQHHNILIFPEGHYERTKQLHYLHTGASRVSIRSKTPILPLSLIGLENVAIDVTHQRPGIVTVRFDGLIEPPKVTKEISFREAVEQQQDEIKQAMISLLPVRYLPDYMEEYSPENVGVFVDIDNTLYKGYSQQDFMKHLMEKGLLPKWVVFRVAFWLFLEKLHLMPHRVLMKRALSIMKGHTVAEVEREAKIFFDENIVEHLQKHMIPVLKDHKEQGHLIVLVTEVIAPLAKQFKDYFKALAVVGTKLEHDKGVYTGEVRHLNYAQMKAVRVSKFAEEFGVDLTSSYAYGDSIADLPMLELVKHKTAVHPDSQLKKVATKRGWPILT